MMRNDGDVKKVVRKGDSPIKEEDEEARHKESVKTEEKHHDETTKTEEKHHKESMAKLADVIKTLEQFFDTKGLEKEMDELANSIGAASKAYEEFGKMPKRTAAGVVKEKSNAAVETIADAWSNLASVLSKTTKKSSAPSLNATGIQTALDGLAGKLTSITEAFGAMETAISKIAIESSKVQMDAGKADATLPVEIQPEMIVNYDEAKRSFDIEAGKLIDYLNKKGGDGTRFHADVQVAANFIYEKKVQKIEEGQEGIDNRKVTNWLEGEAQLRKPQDVDLPINLVPKITADANLFKSEVEKSTATVVAGLNEIAVDGPADTPVVKPTIYPKLVPQYAGGKEVYEPSWD
ncbi:MAG: hypothetical protein ACREGR_04440, partial [Minisyncoccia bacterium]